MEENIIRTESGEYNKNPNEKRCYICDNDSKLILDNYQFNECNHYYCVFCLFRNIFLNHINEFQYFEQNEITIKCKCKKGKKKFSFQEIDDIIEYKSKENHDKLTKYCRMHDSDCELFCKNCEKYICYHCKTEHESKSHKIVWISVFIRMYKEFIEGMPLKFKYIENFKLNLDKSVDKFSKDLEEKTNSAIREINELINELYEIKKNYISKLKKIKEEGLESINLVKKFYLEYYSDLMNINSDNDIFSLRYLANCKTELDNFEMKYNIGIFPKLEDVHKQIQNLKSLTEHPFSLKMNYIDIPTTFRELIRTIGHDEQINCLSRTGDSKFISGSSDNSIKFWNLENEELKPYECMDKYTGNVGCILLLKDGRLCFSSLDDFWIKICEKLETLPNEEEQTNSEYKYNVSCSLSEHTKPITGLIQLNNNNLVSSSRDEKIIVWEMENDNFIKSVELKQAHKGGVYTICEIDNNNFISGGADGLIRLWEKKLNQNEYICTQEFGLHKDKVKHLVYLKNNNICSAGDDGFIKVWTKKEEKYEILWEKEIKDEKITCLTGLKNCFLITGSYAKKHGIYAYMRVWEKNGDDYFVKENIKKHLKQIKAVIELDWGNVVSAGEDGVIIVWKSGVLYD